MAPGAGFILMKQNETWFILFFYFYFAPSPYTFPILVVTSTNLMQLIL